MKLPMPPVTAQFCVDGILLIAVEKKKVFQKVLTWKEMYKLAKKGKKGTPPEVVKAMTNKMEEMIASNNRTAEEAKRLRETLKKDRPSVTGVPVPPVMPVPSYRPTQAAVPVVPPPPPAAPTASGM